MTGGQEMLHPILLAFAHAGLQRLLADSQNTALISCTLVLSLSINVRDYQGASRTKIARQADARIGDGSAFRLLVLVRNKEYTHYII